MSSLEPTTRRMMSAPRQVHFVGICAWGGLPEEQPSNSGSSITVKLLHPLSSRVFSFSKHVYINSGGSGNPILVGVRFGELYHSLLIPF